MKVIDEMDEILLGINEQNITGCYVLHDLKLGWKKNKYRHNTVKTNYR
jgi:hypothetical protein